jgi:predicted nucleotidyltransferase
MERDLNQLVEKLQKTFGDRLTAVVLYGSAAVGDHHAKFSDLNILCVFSQVTPRELGEAEPIFHWWRGRGNPSPLLLSEHEVRTSTDCFPIEFHDIKERNRLLAGRDVVSDLVLDKSFHRAQVEHELRAKLLRLRQKAAAVLSDKDLLRRMLADSLSTFCVLFRHALLLSGVEAKFAKREVIEQVKDAFGVDPEPLLALLDMREGQRKPRDVDPVPLFARYMEQIQIVVDVVDRLEK